MPIEDGVCYPVPPRYELLRQKQWSSPSHFPVWGFILSGTACKSHVASVFSLVKTPTTFANTAAMTLCDYGFDGIRNHTFYLAWRRSVLGGGGEERELQCETEKRGPGAAMII